MDIKMTYKIDENDIVERDEKGRVIKVDKPTSVVRIVYRNDGTLWMTDHHKKVVK